MTPPNPAKKLDGRSLRAQAKRRARREQILMSAAKCFATRGFHATNVADILNDAGISRGTFYLYFDSKDAVFHELLDGFLAQLRAAVTVVDPSKGQVAAMEIHQNVGRVVNLLFDNRYLAIILLNAAKGLDDETDQKLIELHDYLYDMVEGALVNGAEWGLIRPCNERIVASAIIGSVKEVLYHYLVVGQVDIPDRTAVAQSLFDYGLHGLLLTRK